MTYNTSGKSKLGTYLNILSILSFLCLSDFSSSAHNNHFEIINHQKADSLADIALEHSLNTMDSITLQLPPRVNKVFAPWIFTGYRSLSHVNTSFKHEEFGITGSPMPEWLRNIMQRDRLEEEFVYRNMLDDYTKIDCAYWDLPVPPRLPDEDYSFTAQLKKMNITIKEPDKINPQNADFQKRHWLHTLNTGLQFSQAYISPNWYQGGNKSFSMLFNFYWDVQLNTVFHPRHIFQSTLSYKLGFISTTAPAVRKYTISDDLLQYNLRAGYKAVKHWFYSANLQFKTQMFNNYPADSEVKSAAFLSPSTLNVGVGMTYTKENSKKTLKFNASVSPLSYNLITCVDPVIDPTTLNISPGHKTKAEIGSNGDVTFEAIMGGNITYRTRLFLFTTYREFTGDWENTIIFKLNSFLTTQIFAHLRYDTTSINPDTRWGKWMLKELFSIGFSYNFATKKK